MVVKMGSEINVWVRQTTYRARTAPPTGEHFVIQAHGVAFEHGLLLARPCARPCERGVSRMGCVLEMRCVLEMEVCWCLASSVRRARGRSASIRAGDMYTV